MNDDDIRRLLNTVEPYDETREGSLRAMLADFYSRRMRSAAILAWLNGLVALGLAAFSTVKFFRASETKYEILHATVFLSAVIWLGIIKIFAWLAIHRNSVSREIKAMEQRLVQALADHRAGGA